MKQPKIYAIGACTVQERIPLPRIERTAMKRSFPRPRGVAAGAMLFWLIFGVLYAIRAINMDTGGELASLSLARVLEFLVLIPGWPVEVLGIGDIEF